jgi:hypothetical protein
VFIKQLIPFLHRFQATTALLSTNSHPTANLVLPEIHRLQVLCQQNEHDEYLGAFAKSMRTLLDSRFKDILNSLAPFAFAAFCDPRFKHLSICTDETAKACTITSLSDYLKTMTQGRFDVTTFNLFQRLAIKQS